GGLEAGDADDEPLGDVPGPDAASSVALVRSPGPVGPTLAPTAALPADAGPPPVNEIPRVPTIATNPTTAAATTTRPAPRMGTPRPLRGSRGPRPRGVAIARDGRDGRLSCCPAAALAGHDPEEPGTGRDAQGDGDQHRHGQPRPIDGHGSPPGCLLSRAALAASNSASERSPWRWSDTSRSSSPTRPAAAAVGTS